MIREIQREWEKMSEKDISFICARYGISRPTAYRYIRMPEEEVQGMDRPHKRHSKGRRGDSYVNIIYKMMSDGYSDDTIYFYLRHIGIEDPSTTIWFYLLCISQNNFPERKRIYSMKMMDICYPDDVTVIKRDEILKYILTINPKTKRNKTVEKYIGQIKKHYPAVKWTEETFQEFHSALMGKDSSKIDEFLEKYTASSLNGFCECIKKDIAPVKNAISLEVSSGFVEGNNNKFKLIKRIVYGRAKLVNLSKKCFLAFMPKTEGFQLSKLIEAKI